MTTMWFLETFNDIIHGGDPIFRQWFLLQSFTPVLAISTSYVLFVKFLGPAYMSNKKPIKPRYLVSAYNFALVFFYISFIARGIMFIPKLGVSFFCGQLSHRQGPDVIKFFELGHELYMVKYIELLDTVFLVLCKKFNMITNLHVFHHAIVPIFGWVGLRSETSAYLTVFMGFNSIIHILMYIYYGIAVLGPEYQKYLWWKKYLTSLQILQFFSVTIYMAIMAALGCTPSKITLIFSCFLSVLFFFLFINYYRRTFVHSNHQKTYSLTNGSVPLTNGKSEQQQEVKISRTNFENNLHMENPHAKEKYQ